jgi:hypothetical protein
MFFFLPYTLLWGICSHGIYREDKTARAEDGGPEAETIEIEAYYVGSRENAPY